MRAEDEPEFQDWARGRQASLRRTAYLLCGDWHHAQDLVQETLTRLYRRWTRLHDRGALDAYARRGLVHAYTDERRRRSSTEQPVAMVPDLPTRGDDDGNAVLRLTLLAALARMPRSQRAVLVLRYWEDLTQAQTAAVLGCSEGNVKSQAARGLVALRQELTRIGVDLVTTSHDGHDGDGPDGAADLDADRGVSPSVGRRWERTAMLAVQVGGHGLLPARVLSLVAVGDLVAGRGPGSGRGLVGAPS